MNAEQYITSHWRAKEVWTHLGWPRHVRRFDQICKRLIGETCIDVGCAMGHSTAAMADLYPARWFGVDLSLTAIAGARENFPNLTFFDASLMDDLIALGKFDSVVCSEVIEHVEDDALFAGTLQVMARKRLIITTPNKRVNDPGHLRVYTEDALLSLFPGATVEIDDTFFYVTKEIDHA